MSGIHKTALFLSGLPEETSATLLRKLEPETASKVRVEMMRLKGVPREKLRKTVAEFLDAMNTTEPSATQSPVQPAAPSPARFDHSDTYKPIPQTMESFSRGIDLLTLETNRNRVPQEPVAPVSDGPFGFLNGLAPDQIRELLLFETPRIVAVLLTQLPTPLSGKILEQLTPEAQKEVVSILFDLEEIDEEVLAEIEAALKERADNIFGKPKKNIGYAAAKRILQAIDPAVRRNITDILDEKPVETPQKRSLAFEDLQNLPDRGLREIFDSVDAQTALLALVGAPQTLIDRVFGKATPQQEKLMIRQYQSLGPIRQIDVEAARKRVLENVQSSS
ncbi:MAG: hypothetical protein FWC43_00465 [Planctomycetaceae bacterium]|nr:hypothetical protein [Planctomycetaceae bacterium]